MRKEKNTFRLTPRLIAGTAGMMLLGAGGGDAFADLTVKKLRTEGVSNPVGIDIERPSFSWLSENPDYGVKQTSYEISVTTADGTEVWNSGKTDSDRSIDVKYEGASLDPSTRYYWNVKVCDNKGNETLSSEKAYFETGLMSSGWDGARWIKKSSETVKKEEEDIKNYSLSVDFEIKNIAAGVCFAGKDANNYFMWQVNMEIGYPRLRPHMWRNGAASCLDEIDLRDKINIELNKEYNLRIDINGDMADTYINDILVDSRRNPSGGDYGYGDSGIRQDRAWANYNILEEAYFDNFRITDLSKNNDNIIFYEDFGDAGNNRFTTGSITEDGRLYVAAEYSWIKKINSDKYDIEFDMILAQDNAGIIFSATDTKNMFLWGINVKNNNYPVIRRHVFQNGGYKLTDTNISHLISKDDLLNKKHSVKIEVGESVVKTYIDGVLADTFTDESGTLHNGKIGFRAYKDAGMDEIAYYDNIKITEYGNSSLNGTMTLFEDFESETDNFSDGVIEFVDNSKWLKVYSDSQETCVMQQSANGIPVFRKEFGLTKDVKSAKLYSSALGMYEVFVNGSRIGTPQEDGTMVYDELKPGWTEHAKEFFYNTTDITHLVRKGANGIGAQVGTGWWAGAINKGIYGNTTIGFLAKIVVEYEDGEKEIIVTDTDWKASNCGPVITGDIYDGETYDARRNYGWTTAGYDDSNWNKTIYNNEFNGKISAYNGPQVRVRDFLERRPVSTMIYSGTVNSGSDYGKVKEIESSPGFKTISLKKGQNAVIDMGQNMVGWIRFTAKGDKGTRINFKFGEMLNDSGEKKRGDDGPAGSVYTYNLRTAKAKLNYIFRGDSGGETFAPTMTFFGFRYCEITATDDVELLAITGEVVGSEIEEGSSLETSHKDINQLYSNVMWGQRGNFLSIPTDCPQRDERHGWSGDTQIFARAACYNSDSKAFYHKWMGDMRNSQRADGAYADMSPFCWWGHGNSAWGDAGVIVPWTVYLMYEDKDILRENYESMTDYMNFLAAQVFDGYKYNGAGVSFGDWLAYEETDKRYVSVAYYAYVAGLMEKISLALSENENDSFATKAAEYSELFENIRDEFNTRYVNANGTLKENTQTSYLLALKFNLFKTEEHRTKGITALNNLLVRNGYKLSTGFVGTGILNQTLSECGLNDMAYNLILQRNNPSWLYSVDQGATTIWERWDSYTKETGFNDHPWIMNSFNHYAYGAVAEWMYRFIGGIEADEENPGFRHFYLKPVPDRRSYLPQGQERVTSCRAVYNSQYGEIISDWKMNDDGRISYSVVVPMNTEATVYVPILSAEDENVSVVSDAPADCIEFIGKEDNYAVYKLKSGKYDFAVVSSDITGIEETIHRSLNVSPNPVKRRLKLYFNGNIDTLQVIDSNGKTVISEIDYKKDTVDFGKVNPGIYFVRISSGKERYMAKVIKE